MFIWNRTALRRLILRLGAQTSRRAPRDNVSCWLTTPQDAAAPSLAASAIKMLRAALKPEHVKVMWWHGAAGFWAG